MVLKARNGELEDIRIQMVHLQQPGKKDMEQAINIYQRKMLMIYRIKPIPTAAGGLLAASSIAAPPFTLPLVVGAAALEIGAFSVDAALKKSGEKKLSEAKPLLNEAQSYIYGKIESAKKSGDFQKAYNFRNLSDTISKGENAGKVYSVHEHKDGGASFVSQEYREFARKHKNLKGDALNKAYAKAAAQEYYKK